MQIFQPEKKYKCYTVFTHVKLSDEYCRMKDLRKSQNFTRKFLLLQKCYYKTLEFVFNKKNRIAPNKGHKYVRQTNEVNIKHRPKNENQIAYYDTEY